MKTLSLRALNRALLARQHLLEPTAASPLALIEHLCGLQSQSPLSAYFALSARLKSFVPDDLSTLFMTKQVVRLALMRSTVHLVSTRDALWLRPTLQTAIERQFANSGWGKATRELEHAAVAKVGRTLIEKEPLTPEELGEQLGKKWPDLDGKALAQVIRAHVPLVQLPPRGLWGQPGQPRSTSLEQWAGRKLGKPDLVHLVERYLRAFGPATIKDAQTWSGLTGLAATFKTLELVQFKNEEGETLYDLPDAPRPDEDTPAPSKLLGEFEQPLLSYGDRSRVMRPEFKTKLFTVNGIIRAPVLVDGFVAGRWQFKGNQVELTMFEGKAPRDLQPEFARIAALEA